MPPIAGRPRLERSGERARRSSGPDPAPTRGIRSERDPERPDLHDDACDSLWDGGCYPTHRRTELTVREPQVGAEEAGRTPPTQVQAPAVAPAAGSASWLARQQTAGNRATVALMAVGQAKLVVGAADDSFEREADAVADEVVARLQAQRAASPADPPEDPGSGDPPRPGPVLRRLPVDGQPEIGADGGALDGETERRISGARGGGRPLPREVRRPMESAFGSDFGDVTLHAGRGAEELNRRLGAQAFTVGTDIFLGRSAPGLQTPAGQHLLAHELTHTVQQQGVRRRTASAQRRPAVVQRAPDIVDLTSAQAHIQAVLLKAAKGKPYDQLLAAPANVNKLVRHYSMTSSGQLSKEEWHDHNLRTMSTGEQSDAMQDFQSGVDKRIRSGAKELVASIEFWRKKLHPTSVKQVTVSRLTLTGSDLHESGLGTVLIDFQKPQGGPSPFKGTSAEVVIKPESRDFEAAVLGTGGVASQLNAAANLTQAEGVQTFDMMSDRAHGALIARIQGVEPEVAKAANQVENSSAVIETLAITFLTGMFDLHHENVLWKDGAPFLIDADNATRAAQVDPSLFDKGGKRGKVPQTGQSGFTKFAKGTYDDEIAAQGGEGTSDSRILKWVQDNPAQARQILLDGLKGKTGRVVPLATSELGLSMRNFALTGEGILNDTVRALPDGVHPSIGLKGESGGAGPLDEEVARREMRKNFKAGQIPFFTYDYDTGWVKVNGKKIWLGQTAEAFVDKVFVRLEEIQSALVDL